MVFCHGLLGDKLLATLHTVSEMLARSLGFGKSRFTRMMRQAPHLIAPNGVNLEKQEKIGTIFNAMHWDLNFLSIHGQARFPGLRIWLRNGRVMTVKIPKGCLLIQVGKQLEWLTGGYFTAGYHEVVCLPETTRAMLRAKRRGQRLIRVSSTVFGHIATDRKIEVLGYFLQQLPRAERRKIRKHYPRIFVGDQVMLALIEAGIIERASDDVMNRLRRAGLME